MNQFLDPLREPTNSRSRIRQARQKEVSALYEASFDRRTAATKAKTTPSPANIQHEKHSTPTSTAEAHTGTVFCNKTVNVSGQTVDGKDAAISRLIHGDYYTVRGMGVGEIHARPEGKLMRFRSAGPPRDVRRDVGTETFPNQAGQYHHTWVAPPPEVDVQLHEAERMSDTDEVPWHVSRPKSGGLWSRPSTGRPAPSTFRNPTFSSSRKNLDAPQKALWEAPAPRPVTAAYTPRVNPYESALQKQNSHGPGHATVVSRKELDRILEIASRKEFAANSGRAGYYPKDSLEFC